MAVIDLPALPIPPDALEQTLKKSAIFGVGALQHQIERRRRRRVACEDAIGLLRPSDLTARDLPGEASRLAQTLRIGKIGLALAQGIFCHFPLGDVVVVLERRNRPAGAIALH